MSKNEDKGPSRSDLSSVTAIGLQKFSDDEKKLLVKKGQKFTILENDREIDVHVVVAYNGSVNTNF